ncbi:MAG: flavodoxin [Acutalibacteraceae bacterium]
MRYSKKVFILGLLICLCLTACGKEASQNTSTPSGTANSGVENYTKYADYEPVKAEPIDLVAGDRRNILVAYFSRSGNTAIPDGVDAITSASLNINEDGIFAGNAEQIAKWIAEETGGDLFLIQTEYTYPWDYNKTVEVGEGQDADGYHPTLISHVEHMEQYDTIYLVYPIWHYTLSVPVCSFLDEYVLSGKTIYAFAANAGSRFADSVSRIQEADPEAKVVEGVSVSEREMTDAKESVLT